MKKNYLISIIGIGLVSGSMAVGAESWRYNPGTDTIDHTGDFKTVPASEPEMVMLGDKPWVHDESTDTIVYRFDDTRVILAAARIGSQGSDRERLYILSPEASFLDQ